MKNSGIIFSFLFLLTLTFTSCDKGDMKIKKLNHGDGTWDVTKFRKEFYNADGSRVDSVYDETAPAEFVFFRTQTLDGLFDYHFLSINVTGSSGAKTQLSCGVFFDNVRANIETNSNIGAAPNEFVIFMGTWTVEESSRHKQTWTQYILRPDGSLFEKLTMEMKFR
jgi:hypothetical protein